MTTVTLTKRWAVSATTRLTLDTDAESAWALVSRFSRFASADPYHTYVTDASGNRIDTAPARGTSLRIGHGIGLTWFERVGEVVHTRPGRRIAFTDLSKRGRTVGFPHVYAYTLTPTGAGACELTLRVRGRWSATWMPPFAVRCWLWWVMAQAHVLLRAKLALWIAQQQPTAQGTGKRTSTRKAPSP